MLSGTGGGSGDNGAASAMTMGAGDEATACCLYERGASLARGFAAVTGAARLVVSTDALTGAGGTDATPARSTGATETASARRLFERGLARGFGAEATGADADTGAIAGADRRGGIAPTTQARQTRETH